jgi:hypothetical protein
LILELKSIDRLKSIHEAQLLSYMKLAKVNHGFLINFNVEILKHGSLLQKSQILSPRRVFGRGPWVRQGMDSGWKHAGMTFRDFCKRLMG